MKNKITFTLTAVPEGYRSIWGNYAWTSSDRARHGAQSQLDAAKLLYFVDNIRFSPVWVDNFKDYHAPIYMDVIDLISAIKGVKVYNGYRLSQSKERKNSECWFWQVSPVIGADCNVYTCHNQAYNRSNIIGSLEKESFDKVWKMKNFNAKEICTGQCANESKNIFIKELLEAHGDSFI